MVITFFNLCSTKILFAVDFVFILKYIVRIRICLYDYAFLMGCAVMQLVEALFYKPDGCGFDS
jgi:hypothetical protein